MGTEEADFLKRLLATFKVEAVEHVRAMSAGLTALETSSASEGAAPIVETILREAHSLKGAARAVNLSGIETLCQSLESLFAAMKRKEIEPTPELFKLLQRAVDELEKQVLDGEGGRSKTPRAGTSGLVRELGNVSRGAAPAPQPDGMLVPLAAARVPDDHEAVREPALGETIRVPAARIDRLLLQSEELLGARLSLAQQAADLQDVTSELVRWKREWRKVAPHLRALRHSFERNGESSDHGEPSHSSERRNRRVAAEKVGEFVEWTAEFARSFETTLSALARSTEHDSRALATMTDGLLDGVREMLRSPLSPLFEIFPRFVRDLSRGQGKEVDLLVSGAEIEVDRRILQEIKDPLIHLVRNCVDHGIENERLRREKKKPLRGAVTMAAAQKEGGKIEIVVSDDGAGIDAELVRQSAMRLGILTPEAAAVGEKELMELVFQSGVSTSPIITDISGRGLGLAIVREKVERLGGAVTVETSRGVGTTFRLLLPMTMATLRGLITRAGGGTFAIPAPHVERVAAVAQDEIVTVENRETIQLAGTAVSLVALEEVLELPPMRPRDDSPGKRRVILLQAEGKRIAFRVDEIVSEQEVIVKGLGPQLVRVRNVDGATVLGNGQVVPVLNVSDLVKSAIKAAAAPRRPVIPAEAPEEEARSILVVEDSITARTLLKGILEGAGYLVVTAVDGIDGLSALKTGTFDAVVSDVDMPRMNGFDLTAKILSDKRLSELPVVLVTALESREDRERGIDVGANAYIVKSDFEQSNLLDTVRRLV